MIISACCRVSATLLIALMLVCLALGASEGSTAALLPRFSEMMLADGVPMAVLRFDPKVSHHRVPAPQIFSRAHVQNTTIHTNFLPAGSRDVENTLCLDWPAEAMTAFNYAASIWASLISSPVPIVIDACWADLDDGILGYGGAEDYFISASTLYPVALANALSGNDLNGTDVEINVTYNRDFDWYWGTDGNTPSFEVDFVSVALHEICHGLGFSGSMRIIAEKGYWGFGVSLFPAIYDRFTENGAGQALLDFGYGSSALAAELTSNDLYFDGAKANAANGGLPPKLYAPSTWMPGSSYAHLDEVFDGTENALMTFSLARGESVHGPGPVSIGILQDTGWSLAQQAPDLSLSMQLVSEPDLAPGDLVTFTLSVANSGLGLATQVVVTDVLPSDVMTPTWAASPALGDVSLRPSTTYVWDLEGLGAGATGVFTVSGTINPALSASFTLVNTATISAQEQETNLDNNTDILIFGGHRIYLPLAISMGQ